MPKRIRNETGFIKYMTKDEFNLLLTGLERWELNYRVILHIMFYMGLRIGEVVPLRYTDIIGDYHTLRVDIEKGGGIRERIIPDIVKRELEVYIFTQKLFRTSNYLFEPRASSGSKNPHLQASSMAWKICVARKKLGLNDVYFIRKDGVKLHRISAHTCRHWFISQVYEKTKDPILTQRIIGHKNLHTTGRYIYLDKLREAEKEVVNLL